MPIYVYEVIKSGKKPGRRFEVRQKLNEPPLKRDPKTGRPVKRVICAPAFLQNRFDKTLRYFEKEDKRKAEPQAPEKARGSRALLKRRARRK